jgi:mannose-6-phosphate isomerase-like protein (cupin superfamily)
MSKNTTVLILAVSAAFIAGLAASPLAQRVVSEAHAEAAPLSPMVIDVAAMTHASLPATANPEMHSTMVLSEAGGTISIQSGNVAKHIHPKTDEIQYIIEGSGAMWLGGERKEFKPGTLIIIPKGTAHGGTLVSSGPVKAIAIKLPPQAKDDVVYVD